MNIGRFLKPPATELSLYGAIFLIFVSYCILVFLLAKVELINHNDLIQIVTIFVGWIIALLLAVIHLRTTQRDNQKGRRDEVKRSLEIDAFRKVNEALTTFSEVITKATTPYRLLPGSLRVYTAHNRTLAISTLQRFINVELPQQNIALWNGLIPFLLAIESNEIAIIKYDHLRKFIQFTVDDAHEAINNFQQYIQSTRIEVLLSEEGLENLEKECKRVEEILFNVTMYLFDYRIELMNQLLGDIFEEQVPRRAPIDPKFKILVEVATKEKVKEEEKRRDEARILAHRIE